MFTVIKRAVKQLSDAKFALCEAQSSEERPEIQLRVGAAEEALTLLFRQDKAGRLAERNIVRLGMELHLLLFDLETRTFLSLEHFAGSVFI